MKTRELEETTTLLPQFEKRNGLLPVAVQESSTGQILMIGSVNQKALEQSLKTKKATFFSTSKNEIWIKGETSGNYLQLDEVLIDCDQDAIVYKVTLMNGGVCHTFNSNRENRKACFYRMVDLQKEELVFLEK